MQATLFWACAVAPKRLRRFAHAQIDLIWTAADATELDLAAAPNGGSRVTAVNLALVAERGVRYTTAASDRRTVAAGRDEYPVH